MSVPLFLSPQPFRPATSSAAGLMGLVPSPAAGKQYSFLRGDGEWANPETSAGLTTVATIADLKGLTVADFAANDLVTVLGYNSDNDGGGGQFYYDPSSSATANNGTIFAPTVGSGRWLRLFSNNVVSVDWFGAVGDGATDDRTAIQAALNWAVATTRATVVMGAKTYAISDYVSFSGPYVSLIGQGRRRTNLRVIHPSNSALQVSSATCPVLSGFGVDRNQNPSGANIGISMISTTLANAEDIHVSCFITGWYFNSTTNASIRRCESSVSFDGTPTNFGSIGFLWDGGQTGTTLGGPTSSQMIACVVDSSYDTGTSIGLKLYGNAISDLYLYDFGTLRCSYGKVVDGTRATAIVPGYNWDITFINCTDDEYKIHGILIFDNLQAGAITVVAGWTNPGSTSGTGSGIYISGCRGVSITGFQAMNVGLLATARGITIENSTNVQVNNSQLIDLNYGVYLLNSDNCSINGNTIYNQSTLTGATAVLVSFGDRNKIINNTIDGYNAVGILTDAPSNKNVITSNVVVPTNITTKISAGGTGDVTANNIVT